MEKIRIGNDFKISWSVFIESTPYNLKDKALSLYMICGKVRKEVTDYTIEGNTLCWLFRGSAQESKGFYDLLLEVNEGDDGMKTFDLHSAFALVGRSCEAGVFYSGSSVCHVELKSSLCIKNDVPLYDSEIDGYVSIPSDVGGIAKGTRIRELEGRSFSSILDDLLYPPIPTYRKPSVTGFNIDDVFIFDNIKHAETGSKALVPSAAGLDRGEWEGRNVLTPYAGEIDRVEYSFAIHNGEEFVYYKSTDTLPSLDGVVYFEESLNAVHDAAYTAKVYYKEGPVPWNNKADKLPDLAAKAGYVSKTIYIKVTLPCFASTAGANAKQPVVKQPLRSDDEGFPYGIFELKPSGILPQVFKIPHEAASIYEYHDIMGKMVKVDMDKYTRTVEEVDVNGLKYMYQVYTYNGPERGVTRVGFKY